MIALHLDKRYTLCRMVLLKMYQISKSTFQLVMDRGCYVWSIVGSCAENSTHDKVHKK